MPFNSSLCTDDQSQTTWPSVSFYGLEQWEEASEPGPTTDLQGPTEINGPPGESPDYLMTSGREMDSYLSPATVEENLKVENNKPSLYRLKKLANIRYRNKRNNCEVRA